MAENKKEEQFSFEDLGFQEDNPAANLPSQEEQQSMMSKAENLGKGIQAGGTLGFSDELAGGTQALLNRIAPSIGVPSITTEAQKLKSLGIQGDVGPASEEELYRQVRDQERAALEKAKEQNPGLFTTGEVLGSAVVPLGSLGKGANLATQIGKGALTGATAGALTAAGTSEEMPEMSDVAKSAAVGGALGAGLPVVSAGIKGAGKAVKESDTVKYLKDLIDKTRAGVDFSGPEALSDLRGKALGSTKDIITDIDKSNLAKIKARDKMLSEIKDVDVKEGTVDVINSLDQLEQDAAATAKPILDSTRKTIERVFKKGSTIQGEDYKILEDKLKESIEKAADSKDTRLQKLLQDYQSLIKSKVYESKPELGQVRTSIRDENEMLKLLTGEAAPDLAKMSPAEMEKLAQQSLNRLEAPAGTANYGQTQSFMEGVEKTPGLRGSKIPGFQEQPENLKKTLELGENLKNLELSKKLNREGITQGTASPTGLLSTVTGGIQSIAGQGAVTVGKGLRNMDKFTADMSRDNTALTKLIPQLMSKGKEATAKTFQTIMNSPDVRKRQALIFAAMQQPHIRKDLEESLDFQEEQQSPQAEK